MSRPGNRRLALLLLVSVTLSRAQDAPRPPYDRLLELGGVTASDLAAKDKEILIAHEERKPFFPAHDPHLLPAVREALDAPLGITDRARRLSRSVHAAEGLYATLRALGPLLPAEGLPEEVFPGDAAPYGDLDAAPAVAAVVAAATRAAEELRAARGALSPDEVVFLRTALPRFLARTTEEAKKKAQSGEEDVEERERMVRVAALAARIDSALVRAAWAILVSTVESELPALRAARGPGKTLRVETPEGPVLLRGRGNDGGESDAFVTIDWGGDDEFRMPAEPAARDVRVVLDLAGNDIYLSDAPLAWGGALLGLSLVIDAEGDDDYRASDWSLGCGLAGHGALWDLSGNDRYYGGLGAEGVSIFGSGILKDDGGDDEYVAGLFCQGFASTGGLGAVIDRAGDDRYLAGRDEEDIWRRIATFVTFAQGSGYGHRFGHVEDDPAGGPRRWKMTGQLPGGIGILFDAAGNDRYDADVFGQGSAYWYSLGLLVDGGGDDRYRATWYGQGVGTHAAAGCLLDESGNDSYLSRNTSQGCGHDFSVGILEDAGGNDRYRGTTLCQGAGNAFSGLGILLDHAGDDDYRCLDHCWGYGSTEPRKPEAEPYGFFLDLSGNNRYEGGEGLAKAGARWTQGARGFGVDGK